MGEYTVVIEKGGFMTTKKVSEVLETDEVMTCRGTEIECNNFIHGIKPPRTKKIQ